MSKSKEGVLPTYYGAWGRLSIPGITSLPLQSEWLIRFQDPSHCSASCYAHQRYGDIYGCVWLPQVRAAHAPW
jgi:hypothetical protein